MPFDDSSILTRAVQFAERGHSKGSFVRDKNGTPMYHGNIDDAASVCIRGAVILAITEALGQTTFDIDRSWAALDGGHVVMADRVLGQTGNYLIDRAMASGLASWNNNFNTTGEMVVAKLKEMAHAV